MTEKAVSKPAQGLALKIADQLKHLIYAGEIKRASDSMKSHWRFAWVLAEGRSVRRFAF
jgi:hypothetical protein